MGQRIVLIVALAGVLRVVGAYLVNPDGVRGGWFSYAPGTGEVFPGDSGLGPLGASLVWIVVTLLWAAGAVWVLGTRKAEPDGN